MYFLIPDNMKQQVVFITGATPKENFEDYYDFLLTKIEYNPYEDDFKNWNKTLWEKLWDDYEYLVAPVKEHSRYADYKAWKILFEKMFPYLQEEIILVTTSLGSTFILKYLGEADLPIKIKKLFLVAPAISSTRDEWMWSFEFNLDYAYGRVQRAAEQIYIYHSRDDDMVPFEQGLELKTYFPDAIFREFDDRGHFFKEAELPELIEDIKN